MSDEPIEEKAPVEEKPVLLIAEEGQTLVVLSESQQEIRMTAELTKTLAVQEVPKKETHMTVVASNPEQMQKAQATLTVWVGDKKTALRERYTEIQENLTIATKNKWRTTTLKKLARDMNSEIEFYDKVEAALELGYVIVPNMTDLDVFAIRTDNCFPERKKHKVTQHDYGHSIPVPNAQQSERPPLGEGRYVDADTENVIRRWVDVHNDMTKHPTVSATPDVFREVRFPFIFAKPEILKNTSAAMEALCFDDIGILPGRRESRKRGDPMVLGRIHFKKSTYTTRTISFLITWFVNTQDL